MQQNQTAILFFSRTMEEEFKVNNLGMSKAAFREYYQFQIERTLDIAHSSGLPVEKCFSDKQRGEGFGQRLQHALLELKSKGYTSAIVLGNDTPLLKKTHLDLASLSLSNGHQLIGQDQHGGAWIIAIQLDQSLIKGIAGIQWSSRSLYFELQELLNSPIELEHSIDINERADIKILFKSSDISRSLKRVIRGLYRLPLLDRKVLSDVGQLPLSLLSLRGPPVLN